MSTLVFASAVQHGDSFIGRFGLPGKPSETILAGDGKPLLFPTAEIAELNAWRFVGARLNGARRPQIFFSKPVTPKKHTLSEAERLFAPKKERIPT